MANIIYGRDIAVDIKKELKLKIDALKRKPCLCVILVGDNPASLSYVKGKGNAATSVGMDYKLVKLAHDISQMELNKIVIDINNDENIDGILVQMPLPKHISEDEVVSLISSDKDVDGLHPSNVGKLFLGQNGLVACTPMGIIEMLKRSNIEISGKNVVVIGRSKLVGTPVSRLLLNENATVTICHSKTLNMKEICKKADILIVAIGKPKFINREYVNKDMTVIDVGINRVDGKLCGDVDFDDVKDIVKNISPVPYGVGPMTIAMLLFNTYKAYLKRENLYEL